MGRRGEERERKLRNNASSRVIGPAQAKKANVKSLKSIDKYSIILRYIKHRLTLEIANRKRKKMEKDQTVSAQVQ